MVNTTFSSNTFVWVYIVCDVFAIRRVISVNMGSLTLHWSFYLASLWISHSCVPSKRDSSEALKNKYRSYRVFQIVSILLFTSHSRREGLQTESISLSSSETGLFIGSLSSGFRSTPKLQSNFYIGTLPLCIFIKTLNANQNNVFLYWADWAGPS